MNRLILALIVLPAAVIGLLASCDVSDRVFSDGGDQQLDADTSATFGAVVIDPLLGGVF